MVGKRSGHIEMHRHQHVRQELKKVGRREGVPVEHGDRPGSKEKTFAVRRPEILSRREKRRTRQRTYFIEYR